MPRTTGGSECPYGEIYARQLRSAKLDVEGSLRHTLVFSCSCVGERQDLAVTTVVGDDEVRVWALHEWHQSSNAIANGEI